MWTCGVIRAVAKGSVQWGFGWAPGGAHAYRWLTRSYLGTFATHVDKLARVCDEMVDHYVADNILRPLALAISAR